jgi:hypothetical protein
MSRVATREIQFQAAKGSRLSDDDAAIAGPVLHGMAKDGLLSDRRVLDAARPQRSALHKHFTWDDAEAAEKQRLREARNLISAITFIVRDGNEEELTPVRYFVNIPFKNEEGGGERLYVTLPVVHENPDMEAAMLRIAARELAALRERYGRLRRLNEIVNWDALEILLREVG